MVEEPRSAVISARATLASGVLRINHYKPGKLLQEAILDDSLAPLGPALRAEILRAYGRLSDEVANPLRNSINQTQAQTSKSKGSSSIDSKGGVSIYKGVGGSSRKGRSSKGSKGSKGSKAGSNKSWRSGRGGITKT